MATQGQRVNWGNEPAKRRGRSNSRGRKNNDIPLSFYNPLTLEQGSNFGTYVRETLFPKG